MSSDKETVWRGVIGLIETDRQLSEEERTALEATRISTVLSAMVMLEVPDRTTRDIIEDSLRGPITTVLSQLAKGYIILTTTVRRPLPDPDPGWLAAAAEALRQ